MSFVVIADEHCAAVDKTIDSINSLDAIKTELLFAIPKAEETSDAVVKAGQSKSHLAPRHTHTLTNQAFDAAKGDYIQPLLAGQTIDAAKFSKQLTRLDAHKEASCIVKGRKGLINPTAESLTPGPVFLFNCFDKMLSPVTTPAEILFKRGKVALDKHLESLAYTDLALQLSKQGAIIVDSTAQQTSTVEPSNLNEWSTLSQKYGSVLRCIGWSHEAMLEKLVEPLVLSKDVRKLEAQVKQGDLKVLRSKLGFSPISNPEDKERDDALQAAAIRVVLNGGAAQRHIRDADRLVIFSREITERESELRALLESLSWRLTKSLRDLRLAIKYMNGTLDLQCKEIDVDKSHANYLDYLNYEIDKIYKSNSWRVSAPLRAFKADEKLNSLSTKENKQ